MKNEIAITGIGLISNLGFNYMDFWENRKKQHCFNYKISNFNPRKFISRKIIRNLDVVTQYCMSAAIQAYNMSMLNQDISGKDIGVVAGSMFHGIESIFNIKKLFYDGGVENVSPLMFPGIVFNASASQVASELNLTGPNNTINSGFSSGLDAIVKGVQYLETNKAKAFICGGHEMLFDYSSYNLQSQEIISSSRYLPFDIATKGVLLGEGACYFFLQNKEDCINSGIPTYGQIANYSQNYAPNNETRKELIIDCILKCLTVNGENYVDKVQLAVLDGSGSKMNDNLVAEAMEIVFARNCPMITSNKSSIGHTLGASGAFNCLEGVLSLLYQEVCPIYNLINPIRSLNYVMESKTEKINCVLVSAFDPQGNNTCILLKK